MGLARVRRPGHHLGDVLRRLAGVEEGHLLADHVDGGPPKYSVAQVIGYIKGKSAIHIAREELRGATLLGTGLLRLNGRAG